jgi:hypothetical protein
MPPHGNSNGHRGGGDDGCWTTIEGIGLVRTGPRNRQSGPPSRNRFSPPSQTTVTTFTTSNQSRLNHQRLRPQASSLNQDRDYIRVQRDVQMPSDEDLDGRPGSASRALPEYHNHWQYLSAGFAGQRQRLSHIAEEQRSQSSLSSRQGLGNLTSEGSYSNYIKKEHSENNVVFSHDGKRIKSEDVANDQVSSFPSIEERRQRDPSTGDSSRQEISPQKPIKPQNDQHGCTEDSSSPDDIEHEPSPNSDPPRNQEDSEKPGCICPIGHSCESKTNELIDCRTLVLEKEWGKWLQKQEGLFPST